MSALPQGAEWFAGARFGMFVHWGHSSQQGVELSWPMTGGVDALPSSLAAMAVAAYESSAATFDPAPGAPKEWAALAREAGMRYAVFTTRHHDGYSMWPTAYSDYSVATSPCGRDLVGEFVDAFRDAGLRVGLYYSLPDWHHPDYPALTDADRPYSFGTARRPSAEEWDRYVAYVFGQIEELMTGYGTIDELWFDGAWERTAEEWRAADLNARIRELQPSIVVNDRLPGAGDFDTPEQFLPEPRRPMREGMPDGAVHGGASEGLRGEQEPPAKPWEMCLTMNDSWGYVPADAEYKSARSLVHTLCEVAARGGNLLLNVSPRGDGSLPAEQVERLEAIGSWMRRHGRSIVDTEPGLAPWQWYGPSTRAGDRVFLHLLSKPYETVTVRGLQVKRVEAVRDLASGTPLVARPRVSVIDQILRNADPFGELTITVPQAAIDEIATVIELELGGSPS
jgi:alpha-L-fucosidase